MLKSIDATFKVVTPMFMAGSSQNQAEFRIPSLLGALRFWYRATAPPHMQQDIPTLRKAEAGLFGSTDTQAQFLVRANPGHIVIGDPNKADWIKRRYGLSYFGYGPITSKDLQRQYIEEGTVFKLSFIFRPILKDPDTEGLKRAIRALSLFGGLGSRARRGFGSLRLESLKDEQGIDIWSPPENRNELKEAINQFISKTGCRKMNSLPEYTAFSSASRVLLSQTNPKQLDLLDFLGCEMIRYRSYGSSRNGGKLSWGEKAEQIFADDHDLIMDVCKRKKPETTPRRVVFGLPHNYYFGSTNQRVDIAGQTSERRASPLFIHIHALGKEYAAVLTFLPAKFLPDNEKIKMTGNGSTVYVPCDVDWQVITDFLARIPDRMEVL